MAPIRAISALPALLVSCALAAPAAAAPSTGLEPDGVWPLRPQPEVVRGFDPPAVRWGSGHRGVDLAGHLGQPVHAAQAGTVSYAGRVAGRGVVVVDHGHTRTTYQPVSALVSVGDVVGRGERIGRLAFFGSHCLPRICLHWGLIRGVATYLDPLALVGGIRPVRLLPVDGGWSAFRERSLRSPLRRASGLRGGGGTGAPLAVLARLEATAPPPAALAVVAIGAAGAVVAVGTAAAPHRPGPGTGAGADDGSDAGPGAGGAVPAPPGSGPGMGLEVGGPEPLGAHMRVELGRRG